MTSADIMRFFTETCQCGPGAEGCWRPGEDVFMDFANWEGMKDFSRQARIRFYDHLRALGFAQKNESRVHFFVPCKIASSHAEWRTNGDEK